MMTGAAHLKAAGRVLQYLSGTYELWLTYGVADPTLTHILRGWVDSNYASDPNTRKSVTGYVLSLN
eukprot:188869-Rhodomonas_salina.1